MMMFLRRCIYIIIVFFIPTIVRYFTDLAGSVLNYDVGEYKKCLEVTSETIDYLAEVEKNNCVGDYEWDEVNGICVFGGDEVDIINGQRLFERKKVKGIPSLGGRSVSSNSGTMMEFAQGDSRWGSMGFCKGVYKKSGNPITMSNAGCGATALATVISGYGNDADVTPGTVRDYLCNTLGLGALPDGLYHSTLLNSNLLQHFGVNGEMMFSLNGGYGLRAYNEEVANQIQKTADEGYGMVILVPGHYIAVDKGNCPAGKVYFYEVSTTRRNGCMTVKEMWDITWDRHSYCTNPGKNRPKCGFRIGWKYSPASASVISN